MPASIAVKWRNIIIGIALVGSWSVIPRQLPGQSLTSGGLRGTVQTADGQSVAGAAVTLESRSGAALLALVADRQGGFTAQLLTPGEYRVLVEQIGFQPLRVSGIVVTAGTLTTILVTVERRPPPITSVTEVTNAGARGGAAGGRVLSGSALTAFDRPSDLGGVGREATSIVAQGDGRDGLGLGAGGLPIADSRLFVDGVLETLIRHPGLPGEPLSAPLFPRNALNQVQFLGAASDIEWRGVPGTLVSAQSRNGAGRRLTFAPYATFSSAKVGQNSLDNPGDSSATSFQVGAALTAAIVPDTAHLFVEGGYQSLEQPTAAPWANDSGRVAGQPALLSERVPAIGDQFNTDLLAFAAPTVRTWKGGHAQARLDWQLGRTNHLMARLGYANWKEGNPQLGMDLWNGTGTSLKARDLSGAVGVTSSGAQVANELRAGFSMARREWIGSTVTGTVLSGDGIAFGTSPTLPALFDVKRVDLSDALQYASGQHRVKGGLSVGLLSYDQTYRFGASGLYQFGNLDGFSAGDGTFFQVAGTPGSAKFTATVPGVFLEDTWNASPEIQLQAGVRYETQVLPKNKIALDTAWRTASGIANNVTPSSSKAISPRLGFVWNVRGEWVVRGSGGLYQGEVDPSLFAEALLFDGGSTVRRGQGLFPGWPADPGATLAPSVGKRLTLFSGSYRAPRTAKFELGMARALRGGTTLTLSGSYGHSDYLPRRTDLNRADAGTRQTQEGRPVYGVLVKQGSLVTAQPQSNRHFDDYDLVSGLAPTGYADHYEFTAALEHRVTRGLSLDASYTYGKTTDNLVGLLQADPADQLNPFPEGLPGGGDWSAGRSDLDVPHRVAASMEYRSGGHTPFTVGARWRWRSGLPFTPGFRSGVDLNGDGGGNNDPVLMDQGGLPGCTGAGGEFAARNSCRENSVQALDLRIAIGLPVTMRSGGNLFLTLDAFNVASSRTGVVDRAAQLVDPAGSLGTGSGTTITVPLISYPGFGTLLSRRVEPRLLRVGLKMEY